MTKNCLGLCFAGIICIIGMFWMTPVAYAEDTGVLTIDLTPDITARIMDAMDATPEFQPMHIKVVKRTDETEVAFWESDIIKQEDINISLPTGTYKLYVQLQGHRTIWELDNEGRGYEISPSSSTVVPTSINTFCKDVFADAPWRVQSDKIPILVMVKDADGICGDYDLGNVEIYLDEDCDEDNNEADDTLLEAETKWDGVIVNGSFYNLYYPGDWYGITYLDPSEHGLSGEVCFHVVIRDIGGLLDPDSDAHSHFNVTIAGDSLPALTNWHAGDTHYHCSYTDNAVEFGFPVEATVEAGKAIGLDWNAITDHSFDIRDSKTTDPNHKWNALKSDVSSYTTGSYRLILGEEVSCYGHENPPNPLVPRGIVHFLVFGMENFNNVGGTGLDFIPGGHDEKPEGGLTWNLEDVIDIVNSQGGVSYAAHPEGHRGAGAAALDRVPWITEDYDLTGYNGLQVWNGECTQNTDWMTERDDGLEQWKRLLLDGRKDVFIIGGTDAHGDFSHTTHYTIPPLIEETDNAFGKVRTYVYTETFNNDGILNALRNGSSIMTDGPLVIFDITNEHGETAIIGDEIAGRDLTLNIQWESTSDFGKVDHIYVHRGIIGETEEEISEYHLTPNTLSGVKVYSDLASKIPLSKTAYIRINATTDKGNSVYTNPIWVTLIPEVVCVPWQGDEDLFHPTWSGKEITLKGTVRYAGSVDWEWDFGDGSPPATGTATATDTYPYPISARYAYTGATGSQYVATLTVTADGMESSDTYRVEIKDKTLEVEADVAVDEGLWYLYQQQNRYTSGDVDYGNWQTSFRVAHTGAAVQAFENNMHKPYFDDADPSKDPYVDCVRRGLNYLTSKMSKVTVPAGDGDTNGNGFGIACYDSYSREMYEIGMAMMAIVSSETPGHVAEAGPDGVIGRTYKEIVQDMADFCAYAQNNNGGWRYYRNYGGSDNSVTQWPIMGMESAESKSGWGINIAGFVRPRLETWLTGTQCTAADWRYGGFGYSSACSWVNIGKTAGTGITGLRFCGAPDTDSRIVNAIDFIDNCWTRTNDDSGYPMNFGNAYAMYGVKKAFEEYLDDMESTGSHLWYDEYARYLVDRQQSDGHWDTMSYLSYSPQLTTAWATMILRKGMYDIPPTADVKANGFDKIEVDIGQTVYFDASRFSSQDGTYHIVLYEWDWESDGTYDYASEGPKAEHAYSAYGTYIVTLRVTDNRDIVTGGKKPAMTDTDTCTVYVHPPPHPPVADANGPYIGWVGVPLTLDGSGSWDPNEPLDEIVSWSWDLDNDGEFDDASGETVSHTWDESGIYPIALWVTAQGELQDCVEPSRALVEIGNHDPVADANGPYETRPCTPVTLDGSGSYDPDPGDYIVSYEWDMDNDGEYDDATGESPEFHSDVEGVHTIGLKVTDTFGATDTDRTTVSVGNLAPIADADGPYSGMIGEPVLLDGSGSYDPDEELGDEIVSWDWDLDEDGYFDDASGETVEYTWEEGYSGEVCLRVMDTLGVTDTDRTMVSVISVLAAYDLKEDAITELEAINTTDKHAQKEMEKAIEHIQKSLEDKLWVDGLHLDTKHGNKVFDEEKKAVKHLKKLCKCKGIADMTLNYTGSSKVDIRAYDKDGTMITEVLNASKGDAIFINGTTLSKGKLGTETTVKISDNATGTLIDTQKIHTSGSKPLDEGMAFGDLEVTEVSKIIDLQDVVCPTSDIIKKLVQADEGLAKTAIDDANATPVIDPNNQDKVDKEIAKAEEELAKAYQELAKGKPDKAIDHYKKAWKHAQQAIKHAQKLPK